MCPFTLSMQDWIKIYATYFQHYTVSVDVISQARLALKKAALMANPEGRL